MLFNFILHQLGISLSTGMMLIMTPDPTESFGSNAERLSQPRQEAHLRKNLSLYPALSVKGRAGVKL